MCVCLCIYYPVVSLSTRHKIPIRHSSVLNRIVSVASDLRLEICKT
jgi:hypothetical protein